MGGKTKQFIIFFEGYFIVKLLDYKHYIFYYGISVTKLLISI